MCKQERFEKVALIFEEAVEIAAPEKRVAFLDVACGDDPELRAEVEAFIRAHESAGAFLKSQDISNGNSGDTSGRREISYSPGDRLGPYRLLGLIGEGGTSVVYLAEQEAPVRRWVALKVIKPGMDTQQIISRFELERQALALMDHPGIAKVLDAGATPNGRPFFVMELVRGMQIIRHCDQHCLSIPKRLELFIQICQAVLHAHQKGIVHRDIKPDNILVCLHDGRSFPKIIDFGIAKVVRDWPAGGTPGTGTLPFLGTPAYMSPEQAQMTTSDWDTRTDIYSLGALLYELLCGHPPFDHQELMQAGLEEMCRTIRFQDPPSPSERLALLPSEERTAIASARCVEPEEMRRALAGDLDWVCLKALEKERERRYETAANLADDIGRHLRNLPVSAAAPTLHYRLSKLVRRNRAAVATTCAICLLLVGSAIVTTSLALRANSSARTALRLQGQTAKLQESSHAAMIAMHVTSGLAAAQEGNHDQAALWFANAAEAAGPDRPEYLINVRRALSWLEHAPVPVAGFQLTTAFSVLEFSPSSQYLLAIDRNRGWAVIDCSTQSLIDWVSSVGPIAAAAWHPNGCWLAVAQGQQLKIRNAADGRILHQLSLNEEITAVGFLPSGSTAVFAGRKVHALDLKTRASNAADWEHPKPVTAFAFAPQSNLVVSVSLDGTARVFSIQRQRPGKPQPLPHDNVIRTGACEKQTKYREPFLETPTLSLPAFARQNVLLTRTGPYEISAWDIGTRSLLQKLEGMCCSCRFVISQDGTLVIAGLQGSKVGIWDIGVAPPKTVLASHGSCMLDLALGPHAETLVTAEGGGTARLWSKSDGKEVFSAMHHTTEVDKVAYAENGEMIATAQADGLVRLWVLPKLNAGGYILSSEHGPRAIKLDAHGDHFVATKEPAWDADIRNTTVFSAATGEPQGSPLHLPGALQDVAFSPDGERLVAALWPEKERAEGALQFLDVKTGRSLALCNLRSVPCSVAWHPDGTRVASICRSGKLVMVDSATALELVINGPLPAAPTRINPVVSFTPDGAKLISLSPTGNVEVRHSLTGELCFPPLQSESSGFWSFTVSPRGRRIATTTAQGAVCIWDTQTGRQLGSTMLHPGWVYRCRFSPDGTQLLTASHDAKCRIWNLHSSTLSGSPLIHPSEVYDATFTPDASLILTACRDGCIRVWDPNSTHLLSPPYKAGAQAFNIEVTADGRYAVIGSLGNAIHVLSLDSFQRTIPWSAKDVRLFAEVTSGSRITRGEIHALTTGEWVQRLLELRGSKPTLFLAGWAHRLRENPTAEPQETGSERISAQRETSSDNENLCSNESCASRALCLKTSAQRAGANPTSSADAMER